jgi:AraC-like DNA-binding protein
VIDHTRIARSCDARGVWRLARSASELLGDSNLHCYFGRCYAFWSVDATLAGQTVWGFPDIADTDEFIRGIEHVERVGLPRPETQVVDFSHVVGIHPAAFEHLRTWLERHPEYRHPRSAIVRPLGMLGAVVAGFHSTLGVHEKTVVTSMREALAHANREDALDALDALDTLRLRRASNTDTVDRLRALLEGDDPPAGIDAAAAALALPARTLQEHLRRAGTVFRDEQARARLARAKRLVRAGTKLTSVALEVGFSTPQQFATWFKRHVGVTPSEWRATDDD